MIPNDQRRWLTRLAFLSIRYGLDHHCPLPVEPDEWPEDMREARATFVTLHKHNKLRGCIGALAATRPLVEDVSEHAYATAFHDPRFEPVAQEELRSLSIHLSVLSKPEPVPFDSESELLKLIRPGLDGLILREGSRRGTFLPSVWHSLPEPVQFLSELKRKAGLAPDYWSDTLTVERYTTESW